MSFLTRLWRSIRNPTGLVGRDFEGNRYFEQRNPIPEVKRPRRTVEYANAQAYWNYIGGRRRLPAQWSAWLSHTRIDPPTLEELQRDWARQQRLRMNVAAIEKRDQEEQARLSEPSRPNAPSLPPAPSNHLPKMPSQDKYEPEPWAPRARARGT